MFLVTYWGVLFIFIADIHDRCTVECINVWLDTNSNGDVSTPPLHSWYVYAWLPCCVSSKYGLSWWRHSHSPLSNNLYSSKFYLFHQQFPLLLLPIQRTCRGLPSNQLFLSPSVSHIDFLSKGAASPQFFLSWIIERIGISFLQFVICFCLSSFNQPEVSHF